MEDLRGIREIQGLQANAGWIEENLPEKGLLRLSVYEDEVLAPDLLLAGKDDDVPFPEGGAGLPFHGFSNDMQCEGLLILYAWHKQVIVHFGQRLPVGAELGGVSASGFSSPAPLRYRGAWPALFSARLRAGRPQRRRSP